MASRFIQYMRRSGSRFPGIYAFVIDTCTTCSNVVLLNFNRSFRLYHKKKTPENRGNDFELLIMWLQLILIPLYYFDLLCTYWTSNMGDEKRDRFRKE